MVWAVGVVMLQSCWGRSTQTLSEMWPGMSRCPAGTGVMASLWLADLTDSADLIDEGLT